MTLGDQANFHSKMLTFEIADFPSTYNAILGRPCYTKFIVVPNYTYLKLKMPGPHGVITMGETFSRPTSTNGKITTS